MSDLHHPIATERYGRSFVDEQVLDEMGVLRLELAAAEPPEW
jgi:hypothetical protein